MPNIVEIIVRDKYDKSGAMDQARAGIRGVGDDADTTSTRIAGFGSKLASVGAAAGAAIGTAAVGIGAALYKVGETMDSVEDTIRTGTGASGKALDGLVESAKKVGTSVPSDFNAVGDAISALTQRLNVTGKPLEDLAAQFLNLSRITGTDVKTNIENLTRVFGDWSISSDDQSSALDEMYRASQQTGVGIDQLAQNVVKFGAPLRQMGFSFDESIAMIGKFEKEGVNSELVMGSMRIALGKIAKGSQDAASSSLDAEKAQKAYNDAIAKHGAGSIEARDAEQKLTDAKSKGSMAGKEASQVLDEYIKKIKAASTSTEANAIALELFGSKAGPDMAAAIREGRLSIDDLVKSISGGTDTINKASLETMDFAEQWQLTKNRLSVALEPAAAKVFGAIGAAVEANGPKIAAFGEKIGPQLASSISGLIDLATQALPVVMSLTSIIAGLGPAALPIAGALFGIGKSIQTFNAIKSVVDAIPAGFAKAALGIVTSLGETIIAATTAAAVHVASAAASVAAWVAANAAMIIATGGILLAIAAVVAIVVLLVKHWDWVKEKAGELWNAVAGFFGAMRDAVVSIVTGIVDWVKDHWQLLIAIVLGPLGVIIGLVIQNWDRIKAIFMAGVNAVIDAVKFLGALPGIVIDYIAKMVSGAIAKAGELVDWFKGLGGRIVSAIGNVLEMLADVGWNIIQGIWHGIERGWDWLVDKIKNLAKALLDAAKSAIGIGSPSKAFEDEFGGEIPPGAGRGVDKAAGIAKQAVRNMAMGMLDQADVGGYRSASANTTRAVGAAITGQASRIVLQIQTSGAPFDVFLAEIIRNYVKVQGGDVQEIFGT